MDKEIINIIDTDENTLYKISKDEVHEKGLLHIVGITVVFNSRGVL